LISLDFRVFALSSIAINFASIFDDKRLPFCSILKFPINSRSRRSISADSHSLSVRSIDFAYKIGVSLQREKVLQFASDSITCRLSSLPPPVFGANNAIVAAFTVHRYQ